MKKNKKKSSQSNVDSKMLVQLTGRQTAGWIGMLCFIAIWIFLLGVLVGRGTAPVEFDIDALQKELAELREKVLKKEQVVIYEQIEKLSNEEVFDFHDELKKNKVNDNLKIGSKKKHDVISKPAGLEKEDHVIAVKTPLSGLKKKSNEIKKEIASVSNSTPETKSVQKPVNDTGVKKHTIQIASVRDPKDADALVSKLKKQGFPAYKEVGKLSGNDIWYRVRVGMFSNRAESRTMFNKLKKEYKEALLVNR